MALNVSYAFLAASFSALLTGAGFAILLAKFSASLGIYKKSPIFIPDIPNIPVSP